LTLYREKRFSPLKRKSRDSLGSQSLIQRVAVVLSAGVKGRGCEDATHAYLQLKLRVRKLLYSVMLS
jgi:hypothetical protein